MLLHYFLDLGPETMLILKKFEKERVGKLLHPLISVFFEIIPGILISFEIVSSSDILIEAAICVSTDTWLELSLLAQDPSEEFLSHAFGEEESFGDADGIRIDVDEPSFFKLGKFTGIGGANIVDCNLGFAVTVVFVLVFGLPFAFLTFF